MQAITPTQKLKRALWLTFHASSAVGMGFLHANQANAQTEDTLFQLANPDGGNRINTDYLCGRMMKTEFYITDDGLVGGKGKAIGLHWWVKNGGRLADPHLLIGWRYADEAPKAKNPHPEICGRLDCQVAVTHYEAEHPECSAHAQIEQDPSPQGSKWMGHPKGNDSTPTDNDAWESLLHTNATLGREVSRLRAEVDSLNAKLNAVREVLK